jgi:hypothetical protein
MEQGKNEDGKAEGNMPFSFLLDSTKPLNFLSRSYHEATK